MIKFVGALQQNTFVRYAFVSVGALAVDMGFFLALLQAGLASVAASAIGYSAGILAHWVLSSRQVFKGRVSPRGTLARAQQKALFVVSALLGLIVTMACVGLGEAFGLDARIAKLGAIVVSFQLTYWLRNMFIFR